MGRGRTPPSHGSTLRRAGREDAVAIADLIRSSKGAAMPWLAVPHTLHEDRHWVATVLLPEHDVWLATAADRVAGVLALTPGRVEQLYVATGSQGSGIGRLLLDHAKRLHPEGLDLWVFQRNARARRFYEAAGFVLVERTDGMTTEEREPDARYAWTPPRTPHP